MSMNLMPRDTPSGMHNASRNLRRAFARWTQWPKIYWAEVRTKSKTNVTRLQWIAFWLPHELVHELGERSVADVFLSRAGLEKTSLEHIVGIEEQGVKGPILPLGLWGDGVPCNWDRSQSLDCVAMSLPGLTGKWRGLRLPITCLNHKQVCYETWLDLMDVITWSLECLALGTHPTSRHDRSPWLPSRCYN